MLFVFQQINFNFTNFRIIIIFVFSTRALDVDAQNTSQIEFSNGFKKKKIVKRLSRKPHHKGYMNRSAACKGSWENCKTLQLKFILKNLYVSPLLLHQTSAYFTRHFYIIQDWKYHQQTPIYDTIVRHFVYFLLLEKNCINPFSHFCRYLYKEMVETKIV